MPKLRQLGSIVIDPEHILALHVDAPDDGRPTFTLWLDQGEADLLLLRLPESVEGKPLRDHLISATSGLVAGDWWIRTNAIRLVSYLQHGVPGGVAIDGAELHIASATGQRWFPLPRLDKIAARDLMDRLPAASDHVAYATVPSSAFVISK
jgi:hypothetical protein